MEKAEDFYLGKGDEKMKKESEKEVQKGKNITPIEEKISEEFVLDCAHEILHRRLVKAGLASDYYGRKDLE